MTPPTAQSNAVHPEVNSGPPIGQDNTDDTIAPHDREVNTATCVCPACRAVDTSSVIVVRTIDGSAHVSHGIELCSTGNWGSVKFVDGRTLPVRSEAVVSIETRETTGGLR